MICLLERISINHVQLKTCFSSSSLTPKDMTKMGLKVTGATGEAKLKVNNLLLLLLLLL